MKKILEYEKYAEIYKVLANAKRLAILHALEEKELSVDILVKKLNSRKANISQHLAVLRHGGLVQKRKAATRVYYRVADPKILDACNIIQRFFNARKRSA